MNVWRILRVHWLRSITLALWNCQRTSQSVCPILLSFELNYNICLYAHNKHID